MPRLKVVGRICELQFHGITRDELDQKCDWLDDWDYPLGYEGENDPNYPLLLSFDRNYDLEFHLDGKHIFNLPSGRLLDDLTEGVRERRSKRFPLDQFGKFVIEKSQLRIPEFVLDIDGEFDFSSSAMRLFPYNWLINTLRRSTCFMTERRSLSMIWGIISLPITAITIKAVMWAVFSRRIRVLHRLNE